MFNAIIIGGTGATGKYLIEHLIKNPNCNKVTSISRRPVDKNLKIDKLIDIVIDSLFFLDKTIKYWENNDVFFNCIGTTRKKARSAGNFIDIELGISKIAARMALKSKIPNASIISAKGANSDVWASKWIHPLLYMKTMGEKENTIVSDFSFKTSMVFKPGLLLRNPENKQRNIFLNSFQSKYALPVNILAKAMMFEAERFLNHNNDNNVKYYVGNDEIRNVLK